MSIQARAPSEGLRVRLAPKFRNILIPYRFVVVFGVGAALCGSDRRPLWCDRPHLARGWKRMDDWLARC